MQKEMVEPVARIAVGLCVLETDVLMVPCAVRELCGAHVCLVRITLRVAMWAGHAAAPAVPNSLLLALEAAPPMGRNVAMRPLPVCRIV